MPFLKKHSETDRGPESLPLEKAQKIFLILIKLFILIKKAKSIFKVVHPNN